METVARTQFTLCSFGLVGALLVGSSAQAQQAPPVADAPPTVGAAQTQEPAPAPAPEQGAQAEAPPPATPPAAAAPQPQAAEASPEAEALTVEEEVERDMGDHPVALGKSRFRPGKGLSFESEDGDFAIVTRLRAQMLYTLHDAEELEHSTQIRRARLQFGGHYFGKHNLYKVELAVAPGDVGQRNSAPSTSPLLDWYLDFTQLRDLSVRVGQSKVPYSRQRVVSSGDLRLVDRSIVNAEFNLDRDIGIDLRSTDLFGLDLLRYYAGVYAGEGRNTNEAADLGMMYLARVELLPMGSFDDYKEADLERLDTPRLSLGVAFAHIENSAHIQGILGRGPADGGVTDFENVEADMVFRIAGFSLESEVMWRNGDRQRGDAVDEAGDPIAMEASRDGFGVTGQAGYLFSGTRFELAARASMVRGTSSSSLPDGNEYGGGVSYYFAGHAFKLQADYFHLGSRDQGAAAYTWEDRVRVQLQASL